MDCLLNSWELGVLGGDGSGENAGCEPPYLRLGIFFYVLLVNLRGLETSPAAPVMRARESVYRSPFFLGGLHIVLAKHHLAS